MEIYSIKRLKQKFKIIDQTLLPHLEKYLIIDNYRMMIDAIKRLAIRGAPAIGIASAAAIYLACKEFISELDYTTKIKKVINEIEATRPTAVNLFHITKKASEIIKLPTNLHFLEFDNLINEIMRYEYNACELMAENGLRIIPDSYTKFLTHCNTGSLATYGRGTALGVIKNIAKSRIIEVFVDETRPLLQGSRLTMWELQKHCIKCILITDNMAARTIESKKIHAIIVGADRIASNGDVANKIGTYNLAILAKYFKIPFYVVAPQSSFDYSIKSGKEMMIEERCRTEVELIKNIRITVDNVDVYNPAFDITPNELVTDFISDL